MKNLNAKKTKDFFEKMQKEDYKNGSLKIMQWYFNDNIGLGEMQFDIVEIRGNWYVADTDTLTLKSVEESADELLNTNNYDDDFFEEWLEEFYFENEKMIIFFNETKSKCNVDNINAFIKYGKF